VPLTKKSAGGDSSEASEDSRTIRQEGPKRRENSDVKRKKGGIPLDRD